MWGGKNTGHLFKKFPENYRSSLKKQFKFPGIFKPILGDESVFSLWRKRHLKKKQKLSKRWRGFPPDGMLIYLGGSLWSTRFGGAQENFRTPAFLVTWQAIPTPHGIPLSWSFFPQRLCLRKEILRLFLQGCCFRLSVRMLKSWVQDAKMV